MENRCVWCNKSSENLIETELRLKSGSKTVYVCNNDCKNNTQKFIDFAINYGSYMLVGTIISLVIGLLVLLYNEALGFLIVFAGNGLNFIIFPFTRKHTAKIFGIKNSIIAARITGVIMIICGIITAVAIWYFG